MKKLNRKGFTLIELLAVIVVLAIVLVITIPSVLRSVDSARNQSLKNAANSLADWMTRQSELSSLSGTGVTDDEVNVYFAEMITNLTSDEAALDELFTSSGTMSAEDKADALLKDAGIGGGTTDVLADLWKQGNKICVSLTGQDGGRFKAGANAKSAGCE